MTLDEEENLPRCLASLAGLADEIFVVDSGSTDRTRDIAAEAGASVIERPFAGYVDQRQFSLEQGRCEWVLIVDADEWLDETLREAVARVVVATGDGGAAGYELNRYTQYLGKWIDHGGWSPEWRLRLMRRGAGRAEGVDPHDSIRVSGKVGRLPGRLRHTPYGSLSEHIGKVNTYTDIMVDRRLAKGGSGSWTKLVVSPMARFLKMYLWKLGFLDGWRGLVLAGIGAFYVFLKYAKLMARAS